VSFNLFGQLIRCVLSRGGVERGPFIQRNATLDPELLVLRKMQPVSYAAPDEVNGNVGSTSILNRTPDNMASLPPIVAHDPQGFGMQEEVESRIRKLSATRRVGVVHKV
jgi:hypothetical protein